MNERMGSLLAPPLTSSTKRSDLNSPINKTGIKVATIELYRLGLVPGSSRPLQVLSIHSLLLICGSSLRVPISPLIKVFRVGIEGR